MLHGPDPFILLAEDDEDDQELIRLAFSRVDDHTIVQIANNGREALELLARLPKTPCLIILDLNMPVLNGIQTLVALNQEPRFSTVPKVIFTTSDDADNKRTSYSLGAADYIVKPSSMNELVTTARKMLSYCQ